MKCHLCGKEIKGNVVYIDKMQYPITTADEVEQMICCYSCTHTNNGKTSYDKDDQYQRVILKLY